MAPRPAATGAAPSEPAAPEPAAPVAGARRLPSLLALAIPATWPPSEDH